MRALALLAVVLVACSSKSNLDADRAPPTNVRALVAPEPRAVDAGPRVVIPPTTTSVFLCGDTPMIEGTDESGRVSAGNAGGRVVERCSVSFSKPGPRSCTYEGATLIGINERMFSVIPSSRTFTYTCK